MSDVLAGIDQRTRLAGQNRLELLLFYLNDHQRFALNVFKVQEVMRCPDLTRVPGSKPVVSGIASLRGKTIAVIDLNMALGGRPLDHRNSFLIVSEYNRAIQGFLVNDVDRIVNMNWKDVLPMPYGTAKESYLTSVTHVDNHLVGIVDVERIFSEITGMDAGISGDLIKKHATLSKHVVLIVDDSHVARNHIKKAFEQMSVECHIATNGQEALDKLAEWAEHHPEKLDELAMVVSDIEMPTMDGYTLTTRIKNEPRLKHICVMLHSSLSGVFNKTMVATVGADHFVPKFDSNDLIETFMKVVGTTEPRVALA